MKKEEEKPYAWEEIKSFLIKELKKTRHIMTYGTIGSCDIEKDIDVIITKKPSSKTSEFYKEVHNLFDLLNNYLRKKYDANAIKLPGLSYSIELLKLSKQRSKDLVFHVMIYSSYPQMEKDWAWAIFPNESPKDVLINYNCLFGSAKYLFSKDFQKPNYADNIFLCLALYDRINSNYSEDFLVKVMNYYYSYLFRKKLKLPIQSARNKEEVRKIFYQLCDIIDKLNNKQKCH